MKEPNNEKPQHTETIVKHNGLKFFIKFLLMACVLGILVYHREYFLQKLYSLEKDSTNNAEIQSSLDKQAYTEKELLDIRGSLKKCEANLESLQKNSLLICYNRIIIYKNILKSLLSVRHKLFLKQDLNKSLEILENYVKDFGHNTKLTLLIKDIEVIRNFNNLFLKTKIFKEQYDFNDNYINKILKDYIKIYKINYNKQDFQAEFKDALAALENIEGYFTSDNFIRIFVEK